MFDWLQNMRKSAAEKHQEAITAYLDGAMSDRETAAFELRLRDDAELQSEVAAQRSVKAMLARTPRLRAPRSFVLDPAVYGRQKPAPMPLMNRLYPQLRTATLVASLLFAVVLTLNLWGAGGAPLAQDVAMAPAAPEIQMTAVVAESAVFDEAPLAESEESAIAQNAAAVEVPEPADSDDTVEMELVIEEEMAEEVAAVVPATLPAPPQTMEAGMTMSEAAPAGAATDFEVDDGSGDSGELIAPRATPTSSANRTSAGDESDVLATPAPLPTAEAAADGAAEPPAEVADTAVLERDDQTAEKSQDSNQTLPSLGLGGWLAIALGGLSLILLGLTLWARWQARRF